MSGRDVGDVYRTALKLHCPKSVLVALSYSGYIEAKGTVASADGVTVSLSLPGRWSEALQILYDFEQHCPGHLLVETRRLGILRRSEASGER